jgi:hypothetical protein
MQQSREAIDLLRSMLSYPKPKEQLPVSPLSFIERIKLFLESPKQEALLEIRAEFCSLNWKSQKLLRSVLTQGLFPGVDFSVELCTLSNKLALFSECTESEKDSFVKSLSWILLVSPKAVLSWALGFCQMNETAAHLVGELLEFCDVRMYSQDWQSSVVENIFTGGCVPHLVFELLKTIPSLRNHCLSFATALLSLDTPSNIILAAIDCLKDLRHVSPECRLRIGGLLQQRPLCSPKVINCCVSYLKPHAKTLNFRRLKDLSVECLAQSILRFDDEIIDFKEESTESSFSFTTSMFFESSLYLSESEFSIWSQNLVTVSVYLAKCFSLENEKVLSRILTAVSELHFSSSLDYEWKRHYAILLSSWIEYEIRLKSNLISQEILDQIGIRFAKEFPIFRSMISLGNKEGLEKA